MESNFAKDLLVLFLLGAVVFFFLYLAVKSHSQAKKNKESGTKEKDSKSSPSR
jgi:hypothetical protein